MQIPRNIVICHIPVSMRLQSKLLSIHSFPNCRLLRTCNYYILNTTEATECLPLLLHSPVLLIALNNTRSNTTPFHFMQLCLSFVHKKSIWQEKWIQVIWFGKMDTVMVLVVTLYPTFYKQTMRVLLKPTVNPRSR